MDLTAIKEVADILGTSMLVVLVGFALFTGQLILKRSHDSLIAVLLKSREDIENQYKQRLEEQTRIVEEVRRDRNEWRQTAIVARELLGRSVGITERAVERDPRGS